MGSLWGERKMHPTQKGYIAHERGILGEATYGIYPNNPDVTRCHPKRWFSREIPFISGKSRLVIFFLARWYIYPTKLPSNVQAIHGSVNIRTFVPYMDPFFDGASFNFQPGIPRFARQQHLVAMDQLYRSPCRCNGVETWKVRGWQGWWKILLVFCVLRFTWVSSCAANVGMELDEMWETIPFLRGHEFFVSVCIVPLDIQIETNRAG